MNYLLGRAIKIGLVLYLATFVVGIAAGVLMGQDMSTFENLPDSFWYIGMVSALVLTGLFSWWYFKSPRIVPSALGGLYFGLTVVILSFLLDFALFSIGNSGNTESMWEYYSDFRFWVIVLIVLGTAKVVGFIKRPRNPIFPQNPY